MKREVKEKNVEEQFDRTLRFQISFGREILNYTNFGTALAAGSANFTLRDCGIAVRPALVKYDHDFTMIIQYLSVKLALLAAEALPNDYGKHLSNVVALYLKCLRAFFDYL